MNYKVALAMLAGGAAGYIMSLLSQQTGGG